MGYVAIQPSACTDQIAAASSGVARRMSSRPTSLSMRAPSPDFPSWASPRSSPSGEPRFSEARWSLAIFRVSRKAASARCIAIVAVTKPTGNLVPRLPRQAPNPGEWTPCPVGEADRMRRDRRERPRRGGCERDNRAARTPALAMLGLLGLRIFEATGADIADLGEEHGHRVLRVRGTSAWTHQRVLMHTASNVHLRSPL